MDQPIYLDSNVLIESVEGKHDDFLRAVRRLVPTDHRFLTSEPTLSEVLTGAHIKKADDLVQVYERLLARNGLIDTVRIDRDVLRLSAKLKAEFGGKLPDMIHVATAHISDCGILVSNDKRLRGSTRVEKLSIDEAQARLQRT